MSTTQTITGTCVTPGCGKPASMRCPKCETLGRTSLFCAQDCFKGYWVTHKKNHIVLNRVADPPNVTSTEKDIERAIDVVKQVRALRTPSTASDLPAGVRSNCELKLKKRAGLSRVSWMTGSFKDSLTPNTAIRIDTPRLTIRSVQPSDGEWIYSVKGDPRVNKYQLYGQPTGKIEAQGFINGYMRDRLPITRSGQSVGGAYERLRYVFALSPKTAVIPTPASNAIPRAKRLPPFPPLPHADTTYIGNIAFELVPINDVLTGDHKDFYHGPQPLRMPPDEVFVWPNYEDAKIRGELDGWVATLFYEIAPQYWGQGLMNEAMLAAAEFVFFELGLGHIAIDPQVANESSISLARKFPDMSYQSTVTCRTNSSIKQHVFLSSRTDYIKRFGRPDEKMVPCGQNGCAWCLNPRAEIRGEGEICAGCGKRWYCGLECRAADWEVEGAHGQRCKRQ